MAHTHAWRLERRQPAPDGRTALNLLPQASGAWPRRFTVAGTLIAEKGRRKAQEPTIPGSYHTFVMLIRRLQEEDPGAGRKALKRRISIRTRRQLFEDRFNVVMHKIRQKVGKA